MKIILPVFLALCLGIAPVFGQESTEARTAETGVESKSMADADVTVAAEADDTATNASLAELDEAAAALVATEGTMFGNDIPQPSVLRAFGGLGLVLCLLIGAYLGVRKLAPGYFPKMSSGGKNLKIVESIGMGDRRSIALVEVGGKRFLIGSTPQQINMLTALPEHFSLVAEEDNVNITSNAEEGAAFRNLFDVGRKRTARHSGNVLPDEVRQKMRRLREALDNR